ncbi:T9SS type A sorting domain-containing protein [Flavivirga spongiicola]|uniref:T9SS type A sorting domain-containing protein n=1 Tax=Flavivirga spongiicola TaxID=421621 RepID=A0ABU7XPF5_9FLAO|nr:T9SS type A sorting domain-containing protein [Flavivirga sp. MEBiC05379]MDO5977650.1 T9SS type A sorting domain-containing protein [Flavivirga sp. MEBiC05379]
MKHLLLLFFTLIFSFKFYAQCESPILFDTEIIKCDDDIADGITSFSKNDISYYSPDSMHRTLSDANQGINALPPNFLNLDPYYDRVYARLEHSDCYETATVYLEVKQFPVFEDEVYEICESDYDGIATFYLESIRHKIQQEAGDYVSFFNTMEDAVNNSNTLPLVYKNTSNPQTIYMRSGFKCYTIKELELRINNSEPPLINNLPTQIYCPTEIGIYDLTAYEPQLVNDMSNLTFSYYNSFVDMLAEINAIENPSIMEFTYEMKEIFVRVNDNQSGCYSYTSVFFNFTGPCEVNCGETFNLNFCQTRGDVSYTFFNNEGSPLTLEINEGTIDTFGFDSGYIVVRDSDGTELYNGDGTHTTTNRLNSLAGLVFQSTGNSITFEFYSALNTCNQNPDIYRSIDIDINCSSDVGLLKLSSFLDGNRNGNIDANEPYYPKGVFSYEKNGDGIITEIVSSTGQATVVVDSETDIYEVSYEVFEEVENCFNNSQSVLSNISVSPSNTYKIDFPVLEVENCEDLGIYLINTSAPPRPGFTCQNYLVLENLGSSIISSGEIEFIVDSLIMFNYANSNNPNYLVTNNANGFTLDFVNLRPGGIEDIQISLTIPSDIELGKEVANSAAYITVVNDNYSENNTSTLVQTVIGSYDPNDIVESHGPEILYDDFKSDEYLYYTVRFQNVGTADAINVSIDNTLDARLDKSTIQMVSSSHTNVFTRTNNQLNWKFDNIHLPSEDMDEPNSHGYVYYKIKPLGGYKVGDIIPNTAEIYFDFNPAVITNTFNTEFIATLNNKKFNASSNVSISPNPATAIVDLKFDKNISDKINLNVYNIQGKLILNTKRVLQKNTTQINVSSLKSGMYFLNVNDGINDVTQKLIIE